MPPLVIAAGIGAGGSIAGGLLANRKSKEEKNALNAQQLLAQEQQKTANFQRTQMEDLWGMQKPLIPKITNWYSALAGGDRKAILGNYASSLEGIGENYNAATNDIMRNLPRGGEMNLALANARLGKARDVGSIFQGAQDKGMAGLSDLYSILSGNQSNAAQLATGANSSAAGIYQMLLQNAANSRAGSIGMGTQIGGNLMAMLREYLKQQALTTPTGGAHNSDPYGIGGD